MSANDNEQKRAEPARGKPTDKPLSSSSTSTASSSSKLIKKSYVRFDDYLDLNEENMRRSCKRLMNRLYSEPNEQPSAPTNMGQSTSAPSPPPLPSCKDKLEREKSGPQSGSNPLRSSENLAPHLSNPNLQLNGKSYLRSQYERRQERQLNLVNKMQQQMMEQAPSRSSKCNQQEEQVKYDGGASNKADCLQQQQQHQQQQQDLVARSHELSKRRFFEKLERRETMKNFSSVGTQNRRVDPQRKQTTIGQTTQTRPTDLSRLAALQNSLDQQARCSSNDSEHRPTANQCQLVASSTSPSTTPTSTSIEAVKNFTKTDRDDTLGESNGPDERQQLTKNSSTSKKLTDAKELADELIGFHTPSLQLQPKAGSKLEDNKRISHQPRPLIEFSEQQQGMMQQVFVRDLVGITIKGERNDERADGKREALHDDFESDKSAFEIKVPPCESSSANNLAVADGCIGSGLLVVKQIEADDDWGEGNPSVGGGNQDFQRIAGRDFKIDDDLSGRQYNSLTSGQSSEESRKLGEEKEKEKEEEKNRILPRATKASSFVDEFSSSNDKTDTRPTKMKSISSNRLVDCVLGEEEKKEEEVKGTMDGADSRADDSDNQPEFQHETDSKVISPSTGGCAHSCLEARVNQETGGKSNDGDGEITLSCPPLNTTTATATTNEGEINLMTMKIRTTSSPVAPVVEADDRIIEKTKTPNAGLLEASEADLRKEDSGSPASSKTASSNHRVPQLNNDKCPEMEATIVLQHSMGGIISRRDQIDIISANINAEQVESTVGPVGKESAAQREEQQVLPAMAAEAVAAAAANDDCKKLTSSFRDLEVVMPMMANDDDGDADGDEPTVAAETIPITNSNNNSNEQAIRDAPPGANSVGLIRSSRVSDGGSGATGDAELLVIGDDTAPSEKLNSTIRSVAEKFKPEDLGKKTNEAMAKYDDKLKPGIANKLRADEDERQVPAVKQQKPLNPHENQPLLNAADHFEQDSLLSANDENRYANPSLCKKRASNNSSLGSVNHVRNQVNKMTENIGEQQTSVIVNESSIDLCTNLKGSSHSETCSDRMANTESDYGRMNLLSQQQATNNDEDGQGSSCSSSGFGASVGITSSSSSSSSTSDSNSFKDKNIIHGYLKESNFLSMMHRQQQQTPSMSQTDDALGLYDCVKPATSRSRAAPIVSKKSIDSPVGYKQLVGPDQAYPSRRPTVDSIGSDHGHPSLVENHGYATLVNHHAICRSPEGPGVDFSSSKRDFLDAVSSGQYENLPNTNASRNKSNIQSPPVLYATVRSAHESRMPTRVINAKCGSSGEDEGESCSSGPSYSASSATSSGGFSRLPPVRMADDWRSVNNDDYCASPSPMIEAPQSNGGASLVVAAADGAPQVRKSSLLKRFSCIVSRAFSTSQNTYSSRQQQQQQQQSITAIPFESSESKLESAPALPPKPHMDRSTVGPCLVAQHEPNEYGNQSNESNLLNETYKTHIKEPLLFDENEQRDLQQSDRDGTSSTRMSKINGEADLVILPTKNCRIDRASQQKRCNKTLANAARHRQFKSASGDDFDNSNRVPRHTRRSRNNRRRSDTSSLTSISSYSTAASHEPALESIVPPAARTAADDEAFRVGRRRRNRKQTVAHGGGGGGLARASSMSEELESIMSKSEALYSNGYCRDKAALELVELKHHSVPTTGMTDCRGAKTSKKSACIDIDCVSPSQQVSDVLIERKSSSVEKTSRSLLRWFSSNNPAPQQQLESLNGDHKNGSFASGKNQVAEQQQQPISGLWGFSSLIDPSHASGGANTGEGRTKTAKKTMKKASHADGRRLEDNDLSSLNIYASLHSTLHWAPNATSAAVAGHKSSSRCDVDSFELANDVGKCQSLNLLHNYMRRRRHHHHHHHHHGHDHHRHHHHRHHRHHNASGSNGNNNDNCSKRQSALPRHAHYTTRCDPNSGSSSQPCLSSSGSEHLGCKNSNDKSTARGCGRASKTSDVWGQLIKINKSDGSQVIELHRNAGRSWGFFVARGSINNVKGIFISRMHDNVAGNSLAGLLSIGDRILAIDDCPIEPDYDMLRVNQMISKKSKISLRVKPFRD